MNCTTPTTSTVVKSTADEKRGRNSATNCMRYSHHVDRLVTGRPGGVRLIYRVIGALSGAVGRPPRPAAPSRRPLDSRDSQSFVALRLLAAAAAAGHSSDRRRAALTGPVRLSPD